MVPFGGGGFAFEGEAFAFCDGEAGCGEGAAEFAGAGVGGHEARIACCAFKKIVEKFCGPQLWAGFCAKGIEQDPIHQ